LNRLLQRPIFRAFVDLDMNGPRGKIDFEGPSDISPGFHAQSYIAAHMLAAARGEIRQAPERRVIVAFGVGEADARRRGLACGGVIDADVDGLELDGHDCASIRY
jgi:hypothetical protein